MFVLANFVDALAMVVSILLTAMYWLILIRALLSWVSLTRLIHWYSFNAGDGTGVRADPPYAAADGH